MPQGFASERDFVARFLFPKLKEAAIAIQVQDTIDLFVEKACNGTPDISAEKGGKGLFLIESKFKKKVGRVERDIEPRDPSVIDQAVEYAVKGGFPFYATCNVKRIVLFEFKPGVRAYESEIASFDYQSTPNWAQEVLQITLGRKPAKLKPIDDTLVDILHEAFFDLAPELLSSLITRLSVRDFKERYEAWLSDQGIELNEDSNRKVAEQTTHLQINKILFYKAVRMIYPDRLPELRIGEDEDAVDSLERFYTKVKEIDYGPVYQADILTEIPLTRRADVRIRTLIDTLNEFDFQKVESDFLGRLYEKLIPEEERKSLGQFYTPPGIVDFIVQLVVRRPGDLVLDPGCGSGGFLVRSYHRLRELNRLPRNQGGLDELNHQQMLNQIYGIDINQFPAHLSVINLSIQSPRSRVKGVNIAVKDFFDVPPGIAALEGFPSLSPTGESTSVEFPPAFDAVIGNPPYIRQEYLGEKEKAKIKKVIEGEYRGKLVIGRSSRPSKAISLDKQGDIFIYFFLHGLRFLKRDGFLGFISSDKWLNVEYGEPFQQYILNDTCVKYVVEFGRAVFPGLEVDTSVTILKKCRNNEEKEMNIVTFARVKKHVDVATLIDLITKTGQDVDNETVRIARVPQRELKPGKWTVYLNAPPLLLRIFNNRLMKRLDDVAQGVFRGITTGCDDFFILSKDRARELGIERRFLKPCIPAGEKIDGLIVRKRDIEQYFFMVHLPEDQAEDTQALKYIDLGKRTVVPPDKRRRESRRLPEIETIKNRKLWYSLPEPKLPHIVFPMWFRYRYRAFLNEAEAHSNDYFYYIIAEDDPISLVAYLNSTLAELSLEVLGRQYSGMLHTKVYELKDLPVLDVSNLDRQQRDRMAKAFIHLNEAMEVRATNQRLFEDARAKKKGLQGLFEPEARKMLDHSIEDENKAKQKLDETVYDILKLSREERLELKTVLEELRGLRKSKTKVK